MYCCVSASHVLWQHAYPNQSRPSPLSTCNCLIVPTVLQPPLERYLSDKDLVYSLDARTNYVFYEHSRQQQQQQAWESYLARLQHKRPVRRQLGSAASRHAQGQQLDAQDGVLLEDKQVEPVVACPECKGHAFTVLPTPSKEKYKVLFQTCDFAHGGAEGTKPCTFHSTDLDIRVFASFPTTEWRILEYPKLGEGSYGEVMNVVHIPTGGVFAIKRMRPERKDMVQQLMGEASMMQLLRDTHIGPEFKDVFFVSASETLTSAEDTRGYLVMERLGHNLVSMIKRAAPNKGIGVGPGWGAVLLRKVLRLSSKYNLFWLEGRADEIFLDARARIKVVDLSPMYWIRFKQEPVSPYLQVVLLASSFINLNRTWHVELNALSDFIALYIQQQQGLALVCHSIYQFNTRLLDHRAADVPHFGIMRQWRHYIDESVDLDAIMLDGPEKDRHKAWIARMWVTLCPLFLKDVLAPHLGATSAAAVLAEHPRLRACRSITDLRTEEKTTRHVEERIPLVAATDAGAADASHELDGVVAKQAKMYMHEILGFVHLHWQLLRKIATHQGLEIQTLYQV